SDPGRSPGYRWDRHFRRMTWSGYLLSTPFEHRPRILGDSPSFFGAAERPRAPRYPQRSHLQDNAVAFGPEQPFGEIRGRPAPGSRVTGEAPCAQKSPGGGTQLRTAPELGWPRRGLVTQGDLGIPGPVRSPS